MMIMQRSCYVVDCPVCGRPVELQPQYISHEIACGHCRGHFVVYETDDDGLTAARLDRADLLERADQLLHHAGNAGESASPDMCQPLLELLAVVDAEGHPENRCDTSPESGNCEIEQQPTALLVEERDEVFARIATDMAESGMRVVRAKSATEALKLCGTYEPTLVVANRDQPDQSGWLLAGKLRFVDRRLRVWLYQSQTTQYDAGMASFLQVDELFDYGGDLLGLSETIVALMADRPTLDNVLCDVERNEEPAAA